MTFKRRLYNILLYFAIPIRNYKESQIIDEWFREQLKNPVFEIIELSNCTVKLNGVQIWISNEKYASPTIYDESNRLPYKDTTLWFFKEYNKFLNQIETEKLNNFMHKTNIETPEILVKKYKLTSDEINSIVQTIYPERMVI